MSSVTRVPCVMAPVLGGRGIDWPWATEHGSDTFGAIPMDSLITAAARALAQGDPLGALNRIALREDAPALALRGIAMAQLGDLARAKSLLRSAARRFAPSETVARARCVVAEAEIALASRELSWPDTALEAARVTLARHGDTFNATHARYLQGRRLLLIGQLDQAETILAELDPTPFPPALRAAHALVVAGIAIRRLRATAARAALARAHAAAQEAGIPALIAEVMNASHVLNAPAARLITRGVSRPLLLDDIEALLTSTTFVVDACRYLVRDANATVSLATRPVLFVLVRTLAEAWPDDVPRNTLIARAFRTMHADESHRARLRVEMGRLRKLLKPLAEVNATTRGFVLAPCNAPDMALLAHPFEEKHAAVLALLSDGQSWSSSALAQALNTSQRSVQRSLDALATQRKVQWFGNGRARRWMMPPAPGFTTSLLLSTSPSGE